MLLGLWKSQLKSRKSISPRTSFVVPRPLAPLARPSQGGFELEDAAQPGALQCRAAMLTTRRREAPRNYEVLGPGFLGFL